MRHLLIIIIFFSENIFLAAQEPIISVSFLLNEIEQNNTGLSAIRHQLEAEKVENKTGIYLNNPEVEVHYLWGNGSGNRTDYSISQQFDFPTAYHHKRKVSSAKNAQVDLKYQLARKEVLLQANRVCIELISMNVLNEERTKRVMHAEEVAEAYRKKFDKGDANILDYNKSKLTLLNARRELETGIAERDLLIAELTRLNGGIPVLFKNKTYPEVLLATDFEAWYRETKGKNLDLMYWEREVSLGKQQEKLVRSMNMPKFSAGYMKEELGGITFGISIPLWENKNTVKQIQMQTRATHEMREDEELKFYNKQKSGFQKAKTLLHIMEEFKKELSLADNSDLLKKALEAGEISLIDYLLELSIYYEAIDNLIETEKNYQLTVAELQEWDI